MPVNAQILRTHQPSGEVPSKWASVDPATCSGTAVWVGQDIAEAVRLHRPTGKDWRRVLDGCALVVAEGTPYLGRGRRANARTLTILGAVHGVLADAVREVGAELVTRSPAEWRGVLGIRGTRAQCKATARAQLRQLWRDRPGLRVAEAVAEAPAGSHDDEIEAIMLGVSEMHRRGWW